MKEQSVKRWRELGRKYQYALLVMVVGAVLLLMPTGNGGEPPPEEPGKAEEQFELSAFEDRLEKVLSSIQGAGETRVVLTLDSGSRKVLAQDSQQEEQGSSSSVVTVGRGSGRQEVVPLQTIAPNFRGALVVCPGGDDPGVRLALVEAVSALTGLGSDQIAICTGT